MHADVIAPKHTMNPNAANPGGMRFTWSAHDSRDGGTDPDSPARRSASGSSGRPRVCSHPSRHSNLPGFGPFRWPAARQNRQPRIRSVTNAGAAAVCFRADPCQEE